MNTKSIGEISEGVILGRLLKLGRIVLIPFGNNQRYDLVVDSGNGSFIRGQCKTARYINGCVCFASCSTNGFNGKRRNYRSDVEVFWVYCPPIDKIYEVPVDKVGIKEGVLRVEEPKGERRKNMRWAVDFEL